MFSSLLSREATFKVSGGVSLDRRHILFSLLSREATFKVSGGVSLDTRHILFSLLSREATFKVSGGVSLWTVTLFYTALQGDHHQGEQWRLRQSGDTPCSPFSSLGRPPLR
jgi:hypothetical protein